jgi:hypothetical protein
MAAEAAAASLFAAAAACFFFFRRRRWRSAGRHMGALKQPLLTSNSSSTAHQLHSDTSLLSSGTSRIELGGMDKMRQECEMVELTGVHHSQAMSTGAFGETGKHWNRASWCSSPTVQSPSHLSCYVGLLRYCSSVFRVFYFY